MGQTLRESESGSHQLAHIDGTATARANREQKSPNGYKIPLGQVLKHVSKGPDTDGVLSATPVFHTRAQLAVTVITSLGFTVMLMSSDRHLLLHRGQAGL